MKLVFSYNFIKDDENLYEEIMNEETLTEEDKVYIKDNLKNIKDNYSDICLIIESNLINYKLERISKTDLAILVVAIYELKYLSSPSKVIINEAVELSKKYSQDNSYKFVNGLLAKVVNAV